MSGKTFVDTNILIYAHDVDAVAKQRTAKSTLAELWAEGTGAVSMQVLQEFYVTATRKIRQPMPQGLAQRVVRLYSPWCIETSAAQLTAAFRIEEDHHISFWDALIVAAALHSGADRILSENFQHQQVIAGVRIENPFVAAGAS